MALTEGSVSKLFFKYLTPAVAGALVVALYSFVDTIAVGQGVGPNGTAAIAVCVPLFNVVSFASILCGVGGATLYGVAKGKGNSQRADEYFTVSCILMAVIVIALMAAMWLGRDWLYQLFGADEVIKPYAEDYGNWVIIGFPAFVCASFLPVFLRNDDAPVLVFVATATGAAINIFLDWLMVFPLGLGMTGAAIASVMGAVVQSVVALSHFFRKKCTLRFVRPKTLFADAWKAIYSGFGAAFQFLAVIITSITMNNQIMNYINADALAIYGVVITVVALFQNIYSGIGQAAQPLISVNLGAGNKDRISQTYRLATTVVFLLSALFTAVTLLFPKQILNIFMEATDSVLAIAPGIIRIYALSLLVSGYSIFAIMYLQSIGKNVAATAGALLRGVILNVLFLFSLPVVLGADGVWWAIVLAEAVTFCWLVLYTAKTNRYIRLELVSNSRKTGVARLKKL